MENETKPTFSKYLRIGAMAFGEGLLEGFRMVGIGIIKVIESTAYAFLCVVLCSLNLLILIDMLYHACVGGGLPPTWQVVLAILNSLFLIYWVPALWKLMKPLLQKWFQKKKEATCQESP